MNLDGVTRPTSMDLFAGCGGLSYGLHCSGFHHLGLVEFNRYACQTLRLNSEQLSLDWPLFESNILDFDYTSFADRVDLLAAGAPCQPFSLGGRRRTDPDVRNMFPEVFRSVRALRPKVVVLENVRGLKRESFRPYFNYILAQLAFPHIAPHENEEWRDHYARVEQHRSSLHIADPASTYTIHEETLHASDYGVPQSRYRVIMVAVRDDLGLTWRYPEPTHSWGRLLWDQYISGSYWREFGKEERPAPEKLHGTVKKLQAMIVPPAGKRWRTLRDAVEGLPEPIHGIPDADYDFHIGIPGARVYAGHTGNPLDVPAKTIKAGAHGNPGGEHVMVKDDGSIRYFTVREAARVQTFPDDYRFAGSRSEAIRQIGNAVPVELAGVIGRQLVTLLREQPATTRLPKIVETATY